MNIQDLQNVIVMARKFISVAGSDLSAEQGQQAYASIGEVEKFFENIVEQHKTEQAANDGGAAVVDADSESTVSTVDLNSVDEDESAS